MKIVRNKPAIRWGEAFPLGNGLFGAMVYGDISNERIDLSELTFFSGDNKEAITEEEVSHAAADKVKAFHKMRQEAINEDFDAMQQSAETVMGERGNYGTNLPVGYLNIETSPLLSSSSYEDGASGYKRELDLLNGEAAMRFSYGDKTYKTLCFLSHPNKVMVYKRIGDAKTRLTKISFHGLRDEDTVRYANDEGSFVCKAHESTHSDGTSGVTLYGGFRILTDGVARGESDGIYIEDAMEILIYLTMTTDFIAPSKTEIPRRLHEATMGGYEHVRAVHRADVRGTMEKSILTLDGKEEEQGTLELISRMYMMGRYLLFSSSREDSPLPAHLQGIWNDNVACRIGWTCDMHLDINTQMNYWPAESTGLSEATKPLFRWIKERLIPNGEKNAEDTYGCPGWAAELVSNAWGFAKPYWAVPLSPCPTGGLWILTHMWEHYLYTKNTRYLEGEAFPAIESAVRFFDAYLFETEDKCYASGPSISPENSFVKDGKTYYASISPTYEILMIRELFELYLNACDVLDHESQVIGHESQVKDRESQVIDRSLLERVRYKLDHLPPYRVMEDGTLAEFSHDYPSPDRQHRHTSHLLGVYPFHQITPERKAEAEAAKKSIESKLTPEEGFEDTGWARSLMMLYEARLLHPEEAYMHIKKMMNVLLEPNGMIIHPPTRGAPSFDNVYELDGNTGFTACISEMLLQSMNGEIHILPCLPESFKRGEIDSLIARGNISVHLIWDENKVKATLTPLKKKQDAIHCIVRYNDERRGTELFDTTTLIFDRQSR